MEDKLKHYTKTITFYARQLQDIRFAGQVLFVVLVLLISWSGIKAIQANYNLQRQIAALEQENTIKELENTNLDLQNEYYNSDQYLELSARQNFGLGFAGEKQILVPKQVALAHTVDLAKPTKDEAATKKPTYQLNFEAWVSFLLHRQQNSD